MPSTYRAFISYSHHDSRLARRIHARLEAWSIDPAMVGQAMPHGPVPASLAPIFLDRDELAGGGTLDQVILDALSRSDALIVLCSPAAAGSRYVNEEIRQFCRLGRRQRIHPIILDGEPGDPERNCFPPALLHGDGPDDGPGIEPVAADVRDVGDGMTRALAKTVAGLLGVPFDHIVRRAEQRERRRVRLLMATSGIMAALALAAAGLGWLSESRRQVAEHNYGAAISAADALVGDIGHTLANIEGIPLATTKRVFDQADRIYDTLGQSLPDAPALTLSRISSMSAFAAALNLKGDARGHLELLLRAEALALDLAARPDTPPSARTILAMVRWRLATGLITESRWQEGVERLTLSLADLPEGSLDTHDDALLLMERLNVESMLATAQVQTGQLPDPSDVADSLLHRGDAVIARYPAAEDIATTASTLRMSAANLFQVAGQAERGIAAFEDAETAMLAERDRHPDSAALWGGLERIQHSLIELYAAAGRTDSAERARERRQATLAHMAGHDLENRLRQANVALNELDAMASNASGGHPSADLSRLAHIRDRIEAAVADMSPSNPGYMGYLLELSTVVDLFRDAGQTGSATALAQQVVQRYEPLLEQPPEGIDPIPMAAHALRQLGQLQDLSDRYDDALGNYDRLIALNRQRQDGRDDMRRMLVDALDLAGNAAWRLGDRALAARYFAEQGALIDDLLTRAPSDTGLLSDGGQVYIALGEIQVMHGDRSAARSAFERSAALRERLDILQPDHPGIMVDRAWSEARLAEFDDHPERRWPQVVALLERAGRTDALDDLAEALYASALIQAGPEAVPAQKKTPGTGPGVSTR